MEAFPCAGHDELVSVFFTRHRFKNGVIPRLTFADLVIQLFFLEPFEHSLGCPRGEFLGKRGKNRSVRGKLLVRG